MTIVERNRIQNACWNNLTLISILAKMQLSKTRVKESFAGDKVLAIAKIAKTAVATCIHFS